MRRKAALSLVTVVSTALLLPQQFSSASTASEVPGQPLALGEVQPVGPGLYLSASDTYQIYENDVDSGLMARSHTIVGQPQGLALAQDATAGRSDLAVFGPGWEAEFVGGQLNRTLTQGAGQITTTDLDTGEATPYELTGTFARPDGGSVSDYTAADGSTLVETVVWDDLAGEMTTTVVETLDLDPVTTTADDDTFTDEQGRPLPASDLRPSYTWTRLPVSGDGWRVASVGSKAYGDTTVSYDGVGRVSMVTEPATATGPAQTVRVTYAGTSTAVGDALGDIAGQVKDITVTSGSTVQTLARYHYDGSGLLKQVTNPAAGSDLAGYTYDDGDRLATRTSDDGTRWELSFPGDEAVPQAQETAGSPVPGTEVDTGPGEGVIAPAEEPIGASAYPPKCSAANHWMRYTKSGCTTKVAHYGWRWPAWKTTPSGRKVRGIYKDHCTKSPDKPDNFDFRSACDMHDYGYGVIGNSYTSHSHYLDTSKKSAVDTVFYNTLKDDVCSDYRHKTICRGYAWTYYQAVKKEGNPKNGANATN
ncbi:phospholipase A2 [Streptomyces hydrogenans]|uniref:phospholipase A2 n=1 Tax=Streptomyces hydrogenans TaxID=1873719 RepID=UPI003683FE6C